MSTRLSDREIEEIARRIAADIDQGNKPLPQTYTQLLAAPAPQYDQGLGIFSSVEDAVRAAREAQPRFVALKLEHRARIIAAIRKAMLENAEVLAKAAWEETGLGRYEDK